MNVSFCNAGPVLFGCATYVPPLMEYVEKYGINLDFGHNLTKIDGPSKKAWFSVKKEGEDSKTIERSFDMIHVCPPQCAPDFIKNSPLANEGGWVDVNAETLQHNKFSNVFSLGDVASTSNAKTVAAARKQAPIVAQNIIALRNGNELQPFKFEDLGEMLSLGIGNASITGYGITLAGPIAFEIRRFAYLMRMPGFLLSLKSSGSWLFSKKIINRLFSQSP